MSLGPLLRRVDWLLVAAVLLLLYIGERAVKVATVNDLPGDPGFFDRRHIIYILAGLVLGSIAAFVDPKLYRRLFWIIYGSTIGLLIIVLGFSAARGSQRWIPLPFFTLQPSEIGKVTMIVCLSIIVADCVRRGISGWNMVIRASLLMLPPFALVFIQPDLGTSIVYVAITLAILVVAGLPGRNLLVIGGIGLAIVVLVLGILPTVGLPLLRPYQTERITAFLDPDGGSPAAYQAEQSMIAIGSGGLVGRGEGASQTAGNFLPEHHTDFVFEVVGETRGFIGSAMAHRTGDSARAQPRGGIHGLWRIRADRAAGHRQHRHESRDRANDRNSPAVHDLRRFQHRHEPHGHRSHAGRGHPPGSR
jgi:rod shape determining protein RodA